MKNSTFSLFCLVALVAAVAGAALETPLRFAERAKVRVTGGFWAARQSVYPALPAWSAADEKFLGCDVDVAKAAKKYLATGAVEILSAIERALYNGGGVPAHRSKIAALAPCLAYATDGKDVFVNLFLAGTAEVNGVTLVTETDYPWDGRVKITVTPQHEGDRFAVKVRVPCWARGMPVGGKPYVQTVPSGLRHVGGYCIYERAWQAGDVIECEFPMPVKRIRARADRKECQGRFAVERGPLIYCIDGADNAGRAHSAELPLDATFAPRTVTIGKETFPALKASNGVTLIPYYLAGRRAREVQVWPVQNAVMLANVAEKGWRLSASYCLGQLDAVLDGILPQASGDVSIPRYTVWAHLGTTEWVQIDFAKEETFTTAAVYWFDDRPAGGCRIPARWKMQAWREGAWHDLPGDYPVALDGFCTVRFAAGVKTTKVRIVFTCQAGYSTGILEARCR